MACFCYQTKKWIGACAAALGGADTLVFAGGTGEHVAPVRERICEGLTFLGIELDGQRNALHAPLISADGSRPGARDAHGADSKRLARRGKYQALPDLAPRPEAA